ncbi:hypothetical protein F1880_000434 [Penicillium rolfsii]|nr:hypothetical protein F1880_000434 [Penicillium rolfsii]
MNNMRPWELSRVNGHTSNIKVKGEILSGHTARDVNLRTTLFFRAVRCKQPAAVISCGEYHWKLELMRDVIEEGCVKHFLHGTSKTLQLRGPKGHMTGSGRSFFLTIRGFEICRAFMYSEPRFFCQSEWRSLTAQIWNEDAHNHWHPKESFIDLIIACASTSERVWALLNLSPHRPNIKSHRALLELAAKGPFIRLAVVDCYSNFQTWSTDIGTLKSDPNSDLSGILDDCAQFNENHALTFTDCYSTNDEDLSSKTTNLAAVLLFFSLRVAVERATTAGKTESTCATLGQIRMRDFVVVKAFTVDLRSLWRPKGIF